MDTITVMNLCSTCKHSDLFIDFDGEIADNVCKKGSKAVNRTGGLTTCTWWESR